MIKRHRIWNRFQIEDHRPLLFAIKVNVEYKKQE